MTTLSIAEELQQMGRQMAGSLTGQVDRRKDATPVREALTEGEKVQVLNAALAESYRLRMDAEAERDQAIRERDQAQIQASNLRNRLSRDGLGSRSAA